MVVEMSWVGHGEKPSTPAINSAETLKQFIDALGLEKEVAKTPPFNNFIIVEDSQVGR
jgi:hypothetical protein